METPNTPPEVKLHPARHAFGVAGLSIFTLVIVGSFVATTFLVQSMLQSGQLASVISATLVDLTNEDRTREDLGALTMNPVLVAVAQAKANDMAEKEYFAHTSPEGIDPWFWFHDAGYNFSFAGENLAVNFSDSEDVENAWMKSPGHRANILNGKFSEIGIATAVGEYKGKKTTFVVQVFGTPRAFASPSQDVRPLTTSENPEDIIVATTEEPAVPSEVEDTSTQLSENIPEPTVAGAETEVTVPHYASAGEVLLASPQSLLRVLYGLCALIILIALALATRLEFKRHHLRHMIAAIFLLVLMGGLFVLADWYLFTEPQVGQDLALFIN